MLLAAVSLAFQLSIIPSAGATVPDQPDLLKPFGVPGIFASKAECETFAASNMPTILSKRGLPSDATGRAVCAISGPKP